MKVERIDEPFTVEEIALRERLAELHQRYLKEAQPLIDELARIHELKPPRFILVPEAKDANA